MPPACLSVNSRCGANSAGSRGAASRTLKWARRRCGVAGSAASYVEETLGGKKSFERVEHRIMEQALVVDPTEVRGECRGSCAGIVFREAVKPGKMYTIRTNRNFLVFARIPVKSLFVIVCVIVLLARDVHYAFA
jgi:hypothetical protein